MSDTFKRTAHEGLASSLQWEKGWNPADQLAISPVEATNSMISVSSLQKKQYVNAYYQDSCQPFVHRYSPDHGSFAPKETTTRATIEKASKKGSFSDFFIAIWNWMSTGSTEGAKTEEVQPQTTATQAEEAATTVKHIRRPRLKAPEAYDCDSEKLNDELKKLAHRIEHVEEDVQDLLKQKSVDHQDLILYRKLAAAIQAQKNSRHESTEVSHNHLMKAQEVKRAHHEHMQDLRMEQAKADKVSNVMGWVSSALSVLIFAAFVASVILTIVTAGAALAAAITAASAGLAIAQGVNTGVKGYFDYTSQDSEKKFIGERFHRDEAHSRMKDNLDSAKHSTQWISSAISLQARVMKSRNSVISGFFR